MQGAGYEGTFTTEDPNDPGFEQTLQINLEYIHFNALINFKPVQFIQLEGGPGFAMKINSSHELYNQNMDWQVMAGIAGLPDEKIKIGVRYVHGFHPMLKETLQSGGTEYSNTYNRAIQFYAAYDLF